MGNTLYENSKSAEKLSAYLRDKSESHNNYKCYSTLNRIVRIRDDKALYVGKPTSWNDVTDRSEFNNKSDNEVFCKCFSFSRDESVAMWMLYGGIDSKGGMIDFTKKAMKNIINTSQLILGYFKDNVFHEVSSVCKDDFDIYLTDVIYYKKNTNNYYIRRSDEMIPNLSEEIFGALKCCKKVYPWQYENECRLIITIKKQFVDQCCDTVKIDLSNMDLGKSFKRIYYSPNYPLKDKMNCKNSDLDGTVDWLLCKRKNI